MNRRTFIQSLASVFSLPAIPTLSLQSATTAFPAAAVVPAQARSWAVYISTLHGECPPQALQTMLNIPAVDAKKYVSQLIADGVIKPNPLLQRSVSKILKSNEDSLLDKVKKRLEMKSQSETAEMEICETVDATECLDAEAELVEEVGEDGQGVVATEGEPMEAELLAPNEIKVQT